MTVESEYVFYMKLFRKFHLPLWAVITLVFTSQQVSAEPLVYRGDDRNQAMRHSPNTTTASSPLEQVGYSTSYETEYSPYSSFMQSPYQGQGGQQQGNIQQAYGGRGDVPHGVDPYAANEV